MKVQMIVNIKNDDGTLGAETTTIEVDVPNYEAFTGPEQFGEIFDQYERKVLEARNAVVKAATENYLSEMAKKKQSEAEEQAGKVIKKPKHYAIDAEIGLLGIDTYELKEGSRKIFSTERDVFPETCSREHYQTVCFREVVLFSACDASFRRSASEINRVWWRQEKTDQVQSRTIANVVEREGEQIQAHLRRHSEHILQDHGFTTDGSVADSNKAFAAITKEDVTLSREVVCQTIEELNRGQEEEKCIDISELHETFEDPSAVKANISIDDVCCKKQKASGRKKGSAPKEKREMVFNTVAHIQDKESKAYT